jgi:predicted dehydrogenase
MICSGALGRIQYVEMVEAWPRTAGYYRMAPWRGTWAGEGAGVLLNQAPHNFDLLCYLLGMPIRVAGWTRTMLHRIETEDTVQAMLEWPDGALGMIHISTAEAGVSQRLEIVGTAGRLHIGKGELLLGRFAVDMRAHIVDSPNPFSGPDMTTSPVDLPPGAGDHLSIYRNLHEAIVHGAPLMASGEDGRMSLELANAIAYSNHLHSEVVFPLDRQGYSDLLAKFTLQTARREL